MNDNLPTPGQPRQQPAQPQQPGQQPAHPAVNPDPKSHPIHQEIPMQPIHEAGDPSTPVTEDDRIR
jgi:hypothetical protein